MAVPTLDATSGGQASNSYATLEEARDYLDVRPGGRPFLDCDEDDQTRALLFAATMIDREVFWGRIAFPGSTSGTTVTPPQSLQFPRVNLRVDANGVPQVPLEVKHAQIEQALDNVDGVYLKQLRQIELQSSGVRQVTAEGTLVRMQPFHPDAFPMFRLTAQARHLLQRFVEQGAIVGRA